jgi:transposase-like protein
LAELARTDHVTAKTVRDRLVEHGVELRTPSQYQRAARPPEKRFAANTTQGEVPSYRPDLDPCVLFTGATNGNGYGQFRYNDRNGYAHRYAWERLHGPITDDLTIDHLCRVRNCVNVSHMELVDGVTNYLRGVAAKTLCLNKLHGWVDENIYVDEHGNKYCYPCKLEAGRRGWRKKARLINGLSDRRRRYDEEERDRVVQACVDGHLTVFEAAEQLGCKPKYMDKRVRNARRAQGLPDRFQPSTKPKSTPKRTDMDTHCPNGHRWDEDDNLYEWRGQKHCRICRRDKQRERRQERVKAAGLLTPVGDRTPYGGAA